MILVSRPSELRAQTLRAASLVKAAVGFGQFACARTRQARRVALTGLLAGLGALGSRCGSPTSPSEPSATVAPLIFSPAPEEPFTAPMITFTRSCGRMRFVYVDFQVLESKKRVGDRVTLNFFPDATFVGVFVRHSGELFAGYRDWNGGIEGGQPFSSAGFSYLLSDSGFPKGSGLGEAQVLGTGFFRIAVTTPLGAHIVCQGGGDPGLPPS